MQILGVPEGSVPESQAKHLCNIDDPIELKETLLSFSTVAGAEQSARVFVSELFERKCESAALNQRVLESQKKPQGTQLEWPIAPAYDGMGQHSQTIIRRSEKGPGMQTSHQHFLTVESSPGFSLCMCVCLAVSVYVTNALAASLAKRPVLRSTHSNASLPSRGWAPVVPTKKSARSPDAYRIEEPSPTPAKGTCEVEDDEEEEEEEVAEEGEIDDRDIEVGTVVTAPLKRFRFLALRKKVAPRMQCRCQAVEHDLVGNCIECGRIICVAEGIGPCLFCGNGITATNKTDKARIREYRHRPGYKEGTNQQIYGTSL